LNNSNGKVIPIGLEKSFWVKIVVGSVTAYIPAPSSTDNGNTNCVHGKISRHVSEIASLINQARADANTPALVFDAELTTFAQNHVEDMAYKNFLSHDDSNGSSSERMVGKNIFGEILTIGMPQDAINPWRKDKHGVLSWALVSPLSAWDMPIIHAVITVDILQWIFVDKQKIQIFGTIGAGDLKTAFLISQPFDLSSCIYSVNSQTRKETCLHG
jgi:hypothetical protein